MDSDLKKHKEVFTLIIVAAIYCTFHSIRIAIIEYQKGK